MARYARVKWEVLDSTWYRCGVCDSLMILPRPSQKAIKKVYEDDYLHKKLQPHTGVDSRVRYAKEYRPTVYAEYKLSLDDLKVQPRTVKSVLDFGCADGVFLEFCKTYFAPKTELWGTDISESLLDEARQKGWQVVPLTALSKLEKKFDLITLWDVIEHIPDPERVLRELKKLLTPKGLLVIQTPRFGSLAEQFGDTWPHLLPVQHLSVASKEGMVQCARRANLVLKAYKSFGANAPASQVAERYKRAYDTLAKKLDFGDVQIVSLGRRIQP